MLFRGGGETDVSASVAELLLRRSRSPDAPHDSSSSWDESWGRNRVVNVGIREKHNQKNRSAKPDDVINRYVDRACLC